MKISRTRSRSGPIYRQVNGETVSYVVEKSVLRVGNDFPGGRRALLPRRRVFVINSAGGYTLNDRAAIQRITIACLVVTLFALWVLLRRGGHRTD